MLKKGRVSSCGCLRSESSSKRMKEKLKDEEFVKKQREIYPVDPGRHELADE